MLTCASRHTHFETETFTATCFSDCEHRAGGSFLIKSRATFECSGHYFQGLPRFPTHWFWSPRRTFDHLEVLLLQFSGPVQLAHGPTTKDQSKGLPAQTSYCGFWKAPSQKLQLFASNLSFLTTWLQVDIFFSGKLSGFGFCYRHKSLSKVLRSVSPSVFSPLDFFWPCISLGIYLDFAIKRCAPNTQKQRLLQSFQIIFCSCAFHTGQNLFSQIIQRRRRKCSRKNKNELRMKKLKSLKDKYDITSTLWCWTKNYFLKAEDLYVEKQ